MPIYEYRCEFCGRELDALQKLSDDPLQDCPDCEAPSLRRLISAPSFRLKGNGWYETDFKSDKETKRNLVESPADPKGDKGEEKAKDGEKSSGEKSSKKADLKPDSKSSPKSGSGSDSGSGSGSGSSSDSSSVSKSKGSGSAAAH